MCANDGSTKAALACRVTSPDFYNEFDVRVVCYLEVAVVEIVVVAAAEVGDLFGAVAAVEFWFLSQLPIKSLSSFAGKHVFIV